jgi:hypothetical protein
MSLNALTDQHLHGNSVRQEEILTILQNIVVCLGRMVPRSAPALSSLVGHQTASSSQRQREERSTLISVKRFASRNSAPCCVRTRRQVLEAGLCWWSLRQTTRAEGSERVKDGGDSMEFLGKS